MDLDKKEDDLDEELDDIEEEIDDEELNDDIEEEVEEGAEEEGAEEEGVEEDVEEDEDDDIDIEDINEEEVEDVEEEIIDDSEEKEDIIELQDEKVTVHKKKRVIIQRYCKSAKEFIPRKHNKLVLYSRDQIKSILSHYTTERNAEKFSSVCKQHPLDIYQLCGKFIQKNFSHAELLEEIKNGISNWDSKTFKKENEVEAQDIAIMTIKLDVSEGLYECSRCKSKKTYSRQVQTRSADEGMTSIIQCSECNKVWREYA